jgi:uncharacterized membrane protein YeaQ/YmgE (transglycosylase-associated protein family)
MSVTKIADVLPKTHYGKLTLLLSSEGQGMELVSTILIGFVVGLIARFLKPGNDSAGIIITTLVGISGAFVGSALGRFLNLYEPGQSAGWIMSIIGAIVVLFAVSFFTNRSRTAKL